MMLAIESPFTTGQSRVVEVKQVSCYSTLLNEPKQFTPRCNQIIVGLCSVVGYNA